MTATETLYRLFAERPAVPGEPVWERPLAGAAYQRPARPGDIKGHSLEPIPGDMLTLPDVLAFYQQRLLAALGGDLADVTWYCRPIPPNHLPGTPYGAGWCAPILDPRYDLGAASELADDPGDRP